MRKTSCSIGALCALLLSAPARAQRVLATGDFDGDGRADRVVVVDNPVLKTARVGLLLASEPEALSRLMTWDITKVPIRESPPIIVEASPAYVSGLEFLRQPPGLYQVKTSRGNRDLTSRADLLFVIGGGRATEVRAMRDGRFEGFVLESPRR